MNLFIARNNKEWHVQTDWRGIRGKYLFLSQNSDSKAKPWGKRFIPILNSGLISYTAAPGMGATVMMNNNGTKST